MGILPTEWPEQTKSEVFFKFLSLNQGQIRKSMAEMFWKLGTKDKCGLDGDHQDEELLAKLLESAKPAATLRSDLRF